MWKRVAVFIGVMVVMPLLMAQVGPTVFTPRLTVSPGPLIVTTGATTVQDLVVNGTCTGCGGGVGGSNQQIQYNANGTLGGVTGFTYDSNTDTLAASLVGPITFQTSDGININSGVGMNITGGNDFIQLSSNSSGSSVFINLNALGAGNILVGSAAAGASVQFPVGSGGANAGEFDDDSTAGNTRFLLFDVDSNATVRVSVDANDSCGTGFKCLRIPN